MLSWLIHSLSNLLHLTVPIILISISVTLLCSKAAETSMITLFKRIVNRHFMKLQNLLLKVDVNITSGNRLGIITCSFFAKSSARCSVQILHVGGLTYAHLKY